MWYAVDIRKLRFAELRRIVPGMGFLLAAVCKVFRIPLAVDMRVGLRTSVEKMDRHRVRLRKHRSVAVSLRAQDIERWIVDLHNRALRFHADRCVYLPVTD